MLRVDTKACTAVARARIKSALAFANASPPPPETLAKELEYPDPTGAVDYSKREPTMGLAKAMEVTAATVPAATLAALGARIDALRAMASSEQGISIGDAGNPKPSVLHPTSLNLKPKPLTLTLNPKP